MAPPMAATPLAAPPEISAPKLVTSTNPATGSSLASNKEEEDWHSKYLEAKFTCKKLRAQLKDQAKKSRQLIVAVKTKLQDEEVEKIKLKDYYETELSTLCQQLLSVQALMLRDQNRVETLLKEKDKTITSQKQEIDSLSRTSDPIQKHASSDISSSVVSITNLSPAATLGGSLRIHGSFRQYKKDREKIRQHLKSSSTLINESSSSSSSSGINVNSSEDSSSSPSTLPRTLKTSLRQSFSSSLVEQESCPKKKGILKASASIDGSGSPRQTILDNLQQLIETEPVNKNQTTKIQINPECDKSDSGRESDDIAEPTEAGLESAKPVVPNVSVVTVSTDSANSSFDANDPTLAWKINVNKNSSGENPVVDSSTPLKKKVKPPPPPRSSQTKLSTVQQVQLQPKPKSILSPTSSLNPEMSPTEALDHLIHNIDSHSRLRFSENKKKRVKFNPKVDTSRVPLAVELEPEDFQEPPKLLKATSTTTTQPLDPNFLHFLPRLNQKQDLVKSHNLINNNNEESGKKKNFSYYEPYI